MQLIPRSPSALRLGLMAATCALLAPVVHAQESAEVSAEEEKPLQVDTGLFFYKENKARIQSYDAIVDLKKDFGDEEVAGLRISVDSLSGGSPNGAIASHWAQTFAMPSGASLHSSAGAPITYTTASGRVVSQLAKVTLYTVAPGELPLDTSFHDRRIAGDLSWSQPFGQDNHLSFGGHLSHELDFLSVSGNAGLNHDFNSKNTTLAAGFSAELDSVKPVGGIPLAGTDYALLQKSGTSQSKHVLGWQLGVTQVLARNWIVSANFSFDRSGGYLTDPYKILSVVDGAGAGTGYVFERRPDSRSRQSLFLDSKLALGDSILDLSYRHGWDDWGTKSDTVEGRYRFEFGSNDWYLEPHLRWYRQGAADFYHLYLDGGSATPAFMSADPRLAAFTAQTVGLKVGIPMDEDEELSFRLEGYRQNAAVRSSPLTGLSGLDLNPSLQSIVFQVNWRFSY